VVVRAARYASLDLVSKLRLAGLSPRARRAALLDAFSNRLLPNGQSGFFYPDISPLAVESTSATFAAAQSVAGVGSVCVTKLERLYEGPMARSPQASCPLALLKLPAWTTIQAP